VIRQYLINRLRNGTTAEIPHHVLFVLHHQAQASRTMERGTMAIMFSPPQTPMIRMAPEMSFRVIAIFGKVEQKTMAIITTMSVSKNVKKAGVQMKSAALETRSSPKILTVTTPTLLTSPFTFC